jgi:antitoxin component YwqK of YwqJK toxin-antitoxin module
MKLNSLTVLLFFLCTLYSCSHKSSPENDQIVSMQVIDRHGFTETISSKDRLKPFQSTDFLSSQPYQKVLRVYSRKANKQTISKITSYHPNGQIWQYLEVVNGRAHGAYREWYSNGQTRIDAEVIEGVADINDLAQSSWVFNGKNSIWDEQGHLIAVFVYDKGALDTPAFYYHPNGKLHKIIPYQQGLIEGTLLVYDERGGLIEKIAYVQGKKHGLCKAFWEGNKMLYTEEYDQDRLKTADYYNPQGILIAEIKKGKGKQALFAEGALSSFVEFENGEPCGQVELFQKDGTLSGSYMIKEGKKNGDEWEYDPSSHSPRLYIHWRDDSIQGLVKTWYENGVLESQREMNNNKKQGMSLAWYQNGDLMLVEEYENDLLIKGSYYKKGDKNPISKIAEGKGFVTLYTSEGLFLKKISYEKGKPVIHDESLR